MFSQSSSSMAHAGHEKARSIHQPGAAEPLRKRMQRMKRMDPGIRDLCAGGSYNNEMDNTTKVPQKRKTQPYRSRTSFYWVRRVLNEVKDKVSRLVRLDRARPRPSSCNRHAFGPPSLQSWPRWISRSSCLTVRSGSSCETRAAVPPEYHATERPFRPV